VYERLRIGVLKSQNSIRQSDIDVAEDPGDVGGDYLSRERIPPD